MKLKFLILAFFLLLPAASAQAQVCVCYSASDTCQEVAAENEDECSDNCESQLRDDYSYVYDEELTAWNECALQQEAAEAGATTTTSTTTTSTTTTSTTTTPTIKSPITPTLNVNIPDVSFSQVLEEGGYIEVNFLAEYISGIYKYLLAIAAIFAVMMIMIGGIQYIISPGGKGKERINNAVIGLILLFSVYLILFTVNPETTIFSALTLEVIPPPPYAEEDDSVIGVVSNSVGTVSGSNITGAGVNKIPLELIDDIETAAASLESAGISLSIASSFRSVQDQISLIKRNCQNPPGSSACNAKAGKPQTCILEDMNPANCPHTTGRALDIWGVKNGEQCVWQSECLKPGSMTKCFADPCQSAVISAMKAQGFCSLSTEAWHFEKPKMSRKCN